MESRGGRAAVSAPRRPASAGGPHDARSLLITVAAPAITALLLGWFLRSYLSARSLRRLQSFFGLPENSECLLVVSRLTAGQEGRPVFLACGRRPINAQAGTRYLARHHTRLARKHGTRGTFCMLLRVVNSQAYGPDVVELVKDVTRSATSSHPKLTTSKDL